MYSPSIKTKIFVWQVIVLIVGMILVDFVMVTMSKSHYLNASIKNSRILTTNIWKAIRQNHVYLSHNKENYEKEIWKRLLRTDDISSIYVLKNDGKQIFIKSGKKNNIELLANLAKKSIYNKKNMISYTGSSWGVFWKQPGKIIISNILFYNGNIEGCVCVSICRTRYYSELRQNQKIIFFYILINAAILGIFNMGRISKLTLRPIKKLSRKAEEYNDEKNFDFLLNKEKDEIGNLSSSLNKMLNRIENDRESLKESYDRVEKANIELKSAQNEIIRAEKLASVGRLAAGIAHEIGNPIGIVLGYIELLKQAAGLEAEDREYLLRSENEITRVKNIIRQLLDFSRSGAGGQENAFVHETIKDVVSILKVQPLMDNIDIETSCKAEKEKVRMDPNLLRQILINLMINSGDAISSIDRKGKNGKITIETCMSRGKDNRNESIQIKVVDNGPGIDDKTIQNIFDPFYTTKEPGKGTGLGLSVCFMILDQIGGSIKAESTKDKGTTMSIFLPSAEATKLFSKPKGSK